MQSLVKELQLKSRLEFQRDGTMRILFLVYLGGGTETIVRVHVCP